MFGNKKNTGKQGAEKNRKKSSTRKYGQTELKHSRMGVHSCWYAGASLVLLLLAILWAYIKRGESAGFIGGMGVVAVVLAILGIQASVAGLRERERNYITCRIGTVVNTAVLLFLISIFVGGIR